MARDARRTRVLAVSSGGGHWVQLQRLRPAWEGCRVTYVTTDPGYEKEIVDQHVGSDEQAAFFHIPDANRWQKLRLLRQCAAIAVLAVRIRPHVVVTTGAAPGFFAICIAKLLGARTVWIDSIANAERMSLSGQKVRTFADLWLTQWEHLAATGDDESKPRYTGAVI